MKAILIATNGSKSSENVDLIVVGSHGRGSFDRALLGRVAHDVLNRSEFPVLIVR